MAVLRKFVLVIAPLWLVQAAPDRTITQVVKLLQTMMDRSKADGVTERELFAKHKCYCDTNEEKKTSEIDSLQMEIGLLENKIEELLASTDMASKELAQVKKDIAKNEAARASATTLRQSENQAFLAKEADLANSSDLMKQAIDELAAVGADQTFSVAADHTQYMAGHNVSLIKVGVLLKQALTAASAFASKRQVASVAAFLQAPFTGTYTAQAGEVVGILKDMRKAFKAQLDEARASEKKAAEAHASFIQNMLDAHGVLLGLQTKKTSLIAGNDASLASKRGSLNDAQTDLAGAQAFLSSLSDTCAAKKKQYEERVALRSQEEMAIAEAISILNSDAAFATFGTVNATKTGPTAFLQYSAIRKHTPEAKDIPRQRAQAFLQQIAGRSQSSFISRVLSLLQAQNPFTVVLDEIDKMIQLIAAEGTADDQQKSWCETSRTETSNFISEKNDQISDLGQAISQMNTDIDDPVTGLKKIIADNEQLLVENHQSQVTETEARKKENQEYQQDVANMVQAEALLSKAISVLQAYYAKITSTIQTDMHAQFLQRAKDDPNPPATWADDYVGQSSHGGNAIDMLKFILSKTGDEQKQAHTDEVASQHTYEDRMKDLTDEEASAQATLVADKDRLAQKERILFEAHERMSATKKEKETLEAYLLKIKPGCDFIIANIGKRKASRVEETRVLKNAKDLLKDSPVYREAVAKAHNETLGDCLAICAGRESHVECKACRASTSVPGYCAGHPSTDGC